MLRPPEFRPDPFWDREPDQLGNRRVRWHLLLAMGCAAVAALIVALVMTRAKATLGPPDDEWTHICERRFSEARSDVDQMTLDRYVQECAAFFRAHNSERADPAK